MDSSPKVPKVPCEVWRTSDNVCNDDSMTQNKDSLNNSYDPDFEPWEDVELVEERALDNSFASHQTDDLDEPHSCSGRSQPCNETHSSISVISKSTAESKNSYFSSHHNVSKQDHQALQYDVTSNSSTTMQSSRGDSWATVTPLSCTSTPMKANFSNGYATADVKHSEINPKPRESRFSITKSSDSGIRVQNLNCESQVEKNLHCFQFNQAYINSEKLSISQQQSNRSSQEDGVQTVRSVQDWVSGSDQEFSKEEDHFDSDQCSLDHWGKAKPCVSIGITDSTKSRSKFCRTFNSTRVSGDDSKDVFKNHDNDDDRPDDDRAKQMDPPTLVSSVTGLETGDGAEKTTEKYCALSQDDGLRWLSSTGKMMENGTKHSMFDLSLVLSQPPLSVLRPPFKPEDLDNYMQVSQSMLKEKIIRLAALLQACRDLIAWNKEERQQLLAEKETLRRENAEYARNLEGCNQQADKIEKDKSKSKESFVRLLGVANGLKLELRNVRHEVVRKEEEKRHELMQKDEEMRRELQLKEEEFIRELQLKEEEFIRNEEELREEMAEREEQLRHELALKEEEMREEIMQKEEEMKLELIQREEELREEMTLKENQMRFALTQKEEGGRNEIMKRGEEIATLRMMLEKEKERHLAVEESTQRELNAYKESVKHKLEEAEQKVTRRMEQLQGECQRYMQSIRQKGKRLKPPYTKEAEQKIDLSVAEKSGITSASSIQSGSSSAVPASPITNNLCFLGPSSRFRASDNDTHLSLPRRSPMFSYVKSPTAKVRLVSPAGMSVTSFGSKAPLLNSSTVNAEDET